MLCCVVCVGRLKIEELEGERQRLEEQNNVLELRLERHNLQVHSRVCVRTRHTGLLSDPGGFGNSPDRSIIHVSGLNQPVK